MRVRKFLANWPLRRTGQIFKDGSTLEYPMGERALKFSLSVGAKERRF